MGHVRIFVPYDEHAEFRQAKPLRYHALENAALAFKGTLAGLCASSVGGQVV